MLDNAHGLRFVEGIIDVKENNFFNEIFNKIKILFLKLVFLQPIKVNKRVLCNF